MKALGIKRSLIVSLIAVSIIVYLIYIFVFNQKAIEPQAPRNFGATYMTMNNPFFDILDGGIREVVEANGDYLIT